MSCVADDGRSSTVGPRLTRGTAADYSPSGDFQRALSSLLWITTIAAAYERRFDADNSKWHTR